MKTKTIKPSKKMMEALDKEGLSVNWPDDVRGECIDASYWTSNGSYEKIANIDFRSYTLNTQKDVDLAISEQLDECYQCFSVDEEMSLHMSIKADERIAHGTPSARDLVEDLEEAEQMLGHFAKVACAVVNDTPIPERDGDAEKTIKLSLKDCKMVLDVLKDFHAGRPCDGRCEELMTKVERKINEINS